mmetsp:Transcript_121339/g.387841  ORF Transcript_121339/g.387841 Transcript_121339/m.387841 type:complete len:224 (-) Transcript_121339:11-682(-)
MSVTFLCWSSSLYSFCSRTACLKESHSSVFSVDHSGNNEYRCANVLLPSNSARCNKSLPWLLNLSISITAWAEVGRSLYAIRRWRMRYFFKCFSKRTRADLYRASSTILKPPIFLGLYDFRLLFSLKFSSFLVNLGTTMSLPPLIPSSVREAVWPSTDNRLPTPSDSEPKPSSSKIDGRIAHVCPLRTLPRRPKPDSEDFLLDSRPAWDNALWSGGVLFRPPN